MITERDIRSGAELVHDKEVYTVLRVEGKKRPLVVVRRGPTALRWVQRYSINYVRRNFRRVTSEPGR